MLLQAHRAAAAHADFLPHGYCYQWQPALLWTHFWSDLLIGLSYVTISFSLAYLVHKTRRDIPFSYAFVAFGLFIIACGGTHFMDVWTLWRPVYWTSATVKVVTAAASVATAIWMPFLVPKAHATIVDAQSSRAREVAAARAEVLEEQNARLAASERQVRTMLDAIPTLAWTAKADGFIDWYNARWYEYTGTTADEMAGWVWQSVHDPKVLPEVLARWRTAIATGEPFEMTFPLRGSDGVFRPFLTRIAPVRGADGLVDRWFGTNTDLTFEREAAAERERLLAEAKAARDAADEERRRLETVLEQAPVGLVIVEAQSGRIVHANAAVTRLWGVPTRPADVALYADNHPVYHPGTGRRYEIHERPLARVLAGGEAVADEVVEVERPDGSRRLVSLNAAAVRNEQGKVTAGVVLSLDVTEREEERRQLATLVEVLPVMVTIHDPALATDPSRALRFNRAFVETLGWTEEDARAGDLMTLCYPDPIVREQAVAHMHAPGDLRAARSSAGADGPLIHTGARWLELPTRARDGRDVPVLWTNVLLANDRQVGVGVDLTERKAAEAAIAAERTMLRATLDQMPIGVAVAEAPGSRLLYINAAGERILGHSMQPTAGAGSDAEDGGLKDDGSPYAPSDYPLVRAAGGETVQQERQRYRRGDGVLVTLSVSAGPVNDAHGRIVRAVAAWSDVSETVALEDALRRARDAAEAASLAKSEFLARMSHELRTPLNAIQGHVQLIEMGIHGPTTDEQRDALARVTRAQQHLLGLITDILDLSRIEQGVVDFDLREVDVSDLLSGIVPIAGPLTTAKSLTLRVQPLATSTRVWADRRKLTQVLINLLDNAIKFTPAGGEVTVDVGESAELPSMLQIRVTDTGVGISPDQQEMIFQPFVQVQGAYTRDVGGAGLGLAISRDLARGMGGDLRVSSQLGAGSAFTLSLRRATGAEGE